MAITLLTLANFCLLGVIAIDRRRQRRHNEAIYFRLLRVENIIAHSQAQK